MPEEVIDGGLEIIKYPNPILKKTSEPVTVFDEKLAAFVQSLFAAMRAHDGVGLAAPQVGLACGLRGSGSPPCACSILSC